MQLLQPGQTPEDRRAAEILVVGGVLMALQTMPAVKRAELAYHQGGAYNEIILEVDFVKTPYRVSIVAAPELAAGSEGPA